VAGSAVLFWEYQAVAAPELKARAEILNERLALVSNDKRDFVVSGLAPAAQLLPRTRTRELCTSDQPWLDAGSDGSSSGALGFAGIEYRADNDSSGAWLMKPCRYSRNLMPEIRAHSASSSS